MTAMMPSMSNSELFRILREALSTCEVGVWVERAGEEHLWSAEDERMAEAALQRLEEKLEQAHAGLWEIIREFREGKPRGYEGPDTYEEDDPVVVIARRVLAELGDGQAS